MLGLMLKLRFEAVFSNYKLEYQYISVPMVGLVLRLKMSYLGLDHWYEVKRPLIRYEAVYYDIHMPRSTHSRESFDEWAWNEVSRLWINHWLEEKGLK